MIVISLYISLHIAIVKHDIIGELIIPSLLHQPITQTTRKYTAKLQEDKMQKNPIEISVDI